MSARNDQRKFNRVTHDARATLSHADRTWPCTVQDLSLKGCMVALPQVWTVDPALTYRLSIHLSYAIHIEMDVVRAHQDGHLVGFRCVGIDAEDVGKLKRLVELNLGDADLLERDLQALVGQA
jgi:hypothetical protein